LPRARWEVAPGVALHTPTPRPAPPRTRAVLHPLVCTARLPPRVLRSLLRKFGALDEDVARLYITETVLALEYCHAQVAD
jgi:hypothetical protein